MLWAGGALLLSVRVAMLFIATPLFGAVPIPASARVILILTLSASLDSAIPNGLAVSFDWVTLPGLVVHEVLVGGVLAAGLFFGFAAWHFAGRLLDLQIGFGVASLVDIATKSSMPLLASLLSMTAALVFFTVDGHWALLKVLYLSVERLPPGTGLGEIDFGWLIAQFGMCFSFGLVVAAPIVLVLLLIDFGVAFMSRTMPQMNVFVLSLSLKVVVGLVLLAIMVPLLGGSMRRIFEAIFGMWARAVA